MIKLENITVQIASKILLENTTIQISDGQKVGIVGNNGCGKSTLFKVLKGEHDINSGEYICTTKQLKAFAEQEISAKDLEKPILEYVLSKDKRLTELREKEKTASPEEIPEIMEQLLQIDAYSAEARTSEILRGLGFEQQDLSRPVKDFSGGWQMRLNLAGALFQPSDILFLDEPTNHLDIETIIWLEDYLQNYSGTLLLISHDRDFLNNVCKGIIHFEGKKLVFYNGNYDNFIRQYTQKIELVNKQIKKQNEHRAHLQSYIDRFRYKASKAKQAQSRIKMLEKMQNIQEVALDKESNFVFPDITPLPSPLIKIENASVGYDGVPVLKRLNLYISQDDRIALLGRNGNGKSTLVKMISGRLPLLDGSMQKSNKLKIGYFHQKQTEELPLDLTPTEYMQSLEPDKQENHIRAHLGRFGLEQEKAITKISELSGGEKTRLLFARISIDTPELIIFDEPTNHLDMTGRTALAEAINNYKGAIILISHDFHLIEMVADELWLVNNHTCKSYEGSLDNYRDFLLNKKTETSNKPKVEKSFPKNNKNNRKDKAILRELEKTLEQLEAKKENILTKFISITENTEIIKLQKELKDTENQISQIEEEWLSLSENI